MTVLAHGSFSESTGTFIFDTDVNDGSDFGIFDTPFGTANRVDQVNYHITHKTAPGLHDCGVGCDPIRLDYDEFFRLNARRSDGSFAMLFHRNRAILNKTSTTDGFQIFE